MPLWHLSIVMALYHSSRCRRLSPHLGDPETEVAKDLESALAQDDVCIVHNDWPQWREWIAADFSRMRRKVVVDGRRILRRDALVAVDSRPSVAETPIHRRGEPARGDRGVPWSA